MPDFNIKNNPVFKNTMRKLETSDRAHANVFNALFETLLDNDNSLKKTLEKSGEDLDEKIDSKGGDISKTKVGTIKESSAEFPIPEKDDTQETLWGKLKKWQQDCLAKFGNYVLTSMITNQHLNDTNRVPSSALVYLMQQAITQLNMDLAGKNPRIELVASYNNDIVVSPTTWIVAFNHQLPAGLYIIFLLLEHISDKYMWIILRLQQLKII